MSAILEQKIREAILSVQATFPDPRWHQWAEGWLDGTDRSEESATAALEIAKAEFSATSTSRNPPDSAVVAGAAQTAAYMAIALPGIIKLRAQGYGDLADGIEQRTIRAAEITARSALRFKSDDSN